VRAAGVVTFLPMAELAIELFHFHRAVGDSVKLLGMAVGAFDGAFILRWLVRDEGIQEEENAGCDQRASDQGKGYEG
jgi:hypothetical protein